MVIFFFLVGGIDMTEYYDNMIGKYVIAEGLWCRAEDWGMWWDPTRTGRTIYMVWWSIPFTGRASVYKALIGAPRGANG